MRTRAGGARTAVGTAAAATARWRRELGGGTLALLTVGSVMGSGLFLASGLAMREAGAFTLVFVAAGALAMYLEMRALAEMAVATPEPGSFLVYMARVWGPGWTFVTGWVFWFSSVLTMSSEVTAAATFTRLWFPQVPLWTWSLAYSALVIALNFLSVRGFGAVEGAMAAVKALAVAAFVLAAAWTLWPVVTGGAPLAAPAPLLPRGWVGAAPAFLLVLFAYAGTGVIGLAAAETAHPRRAIAFAATAATLYLALAYLASVAALLWLVPLSRMSAGVSPFVLAVRRLGIPAGGTVMNLVLLLAVLSTMNAALYGNVRVLYGLARQGEAPAALAELDRRGQPARAVWVSAGLLALTIVLAYALPAKAYAYLVTATGFQAMFIWLMVLLTHLRYRPYLERRMPERLTYRLPGYPWTTVAAMALVAVGLLASPLAHGELAGALVGFGGVAAAAAVWAGVRGRLRVGVERPRA